jgi:NAD(P)-dependent dehydrogenase (short-subunit alcohol dehydrogenase family)
MESLLDKVAVVTGGASGIGLAMAERFLAEGMKVVIADVEAPALAAAVERLGAEGREVLAVRTDVTLWADVEALADAAYERYGAVHVVCNNAGVVTRGAAWEQSLEDWKWVIGVDLWGVIHGVKAFVPRMLASGEPGHVVSTASIAGLFAMPTIAPYNVAKVGVVALSETLHHDLRAAGSSIGVSVLCPGVVPTRIGDSDRNRPEGAPAGTRFETATQRQPPPTARTVEQVAELVVDAIRTDRFWILTHPEYHEWVRKKADGIIEGTTVIAPPVF